MAGKVPWIRDVWAGNLEEEMEVLRGLVDKYPFVAMVGAGLGAVVLLSTGGGGEEEGG